MRRIALIGLGMLLFTSCATMQQRRQNFVKANPGINDQQKDAILKGDITAGMTEDMVRAAWGDPIDVIKEVLEGESVISWIYQQQSDDLINTYRVRFKDGLVNEVKLINARQRIYSPYYRRYYWKYYPEFP
jgi:hypothetical protein